MGEIGGPAAKLVPRSSLKMATVRTMRPSIFPACLALIGILLPSSVQILIVGAKFTVARVGIILLLIPALLKFTKRGRHALVADLLAFATGFWMLVAAVQTGGLASLPAAPGAEAIEFLGGYLVARGFFFGVAAIETFITVLRVFAICSILLAVGDTVTGRWMIQDVVAGIVGAVPPGPVFRESLVRATSTFDHPILFGTFCSMVAGVLLYSARNTLTRIAYVIICFVGTALSLSSAALMSFVIVLFSYTYDKLMYRYTWRWYVIWSCVFVALLGLFVLSNRPLGFLISHLTLDPQSSYFRLLIWDAALIRIGEFPLTGFGFGLFNHEILDTTIDSVWLVSSLHYGVPMVMLLFATNIATFWPRQKLLTSRDGLMVKQLSCAFTIVLVIFMFAGFTVHFWNFMWTFWGLCLGVRASLREAAKWAILPKSASGA